MGHEIAGEIVQVGPKVSRYHPGERVFVSHHVPCNTCRYCLNGDHTACDTLHTTNFDPGGFAEYLRVPPINVDRGTFPLPDEVTNEEAVFIEPLACVARAQRQARLKAGDAVLILGSGISGLLHLMLAKTLGAGRIIATDLNAYRMEKAGQLGADVVLDGREDIPARVREVNDGRPADLVIVCTGAFAAFQQALSSVDRGGTVLCFAPTGPGVELPIPVNDFWRNSIGILPSYGNSPYDAVVALELIRSRRVPVASMVTHRLGLGDAAEGFRLVAEAAESIKVILEPQR